MGRRMRIGLGLAAAAIVTTLLVTYSASAKREASPAAKVGQAGQPGVSRCGLGNGRRATGRPIRLGGIFTKSPGIDFTPIGQIANAYFRCVNANGGINGRPIQYFIETEADQPDRVASLPVRLANQRKVLAIVGNTSNTDCIVNHRYYERNGFNVIGAGVPSECFTTRAFAAVNMGPHYSNKGAAQALVRAGARSIIGISSNVPGANPYYNSGAIAVGRKAGLKTGNRYEDVPIQDANSLVLRLVQEAGPNGGVDFALIPPEGLKVMLAAQRQNLVDRVKWSGATPFNSSFIATSIGREWNGKFLTNAEFNLIDSRGPDNRLFVQLFRRYYPRCDACFGSFGQMGYLVGKVVTYTLLALQPNQLTKRGVNAAFLRIKNFKSDLWCKPWYYGNLQYHIPNNWDRTVVPQNGKWVQKEGCFAIDAVGDRRLLQTRRWERERKLTSGTSWPPIPAR
jgi:branched-chain amino acid transport system substrate-binding protein